MSDETPNASSATAPGALKRCWRALRKPSVKYSFIGIASLFFVLGIIFWGGFNTGLEATNTLEFCISCHEMRDNVYQEYKKTIHFSNRTGVRAICSDCHVPHDWTHKLIRKSKASLEVWGQDDRQNRHQGEVRSQPDAPGDPRVGAHEGQLVRANAATATTSTP
jgi:hypothetical protein